MGKWEESLRRKSKNPWGKFNWRKSPWWSRQKKESHGGDKAGSNPEQSHLENK